MTNLFPGMLFDRIRVGRLRLLFKKKSIRQQDGFIGSAWRGLIGKTLKRIFCSWRDKRCIDCLVRSTCPYYILYEEHGNEPGFSDLPRPYIFYPLPVTDNRYLSLEVTLFGQGCEFVPHLITTCEEAGYYGLGRERIRFSLQCVLQKELNGEWTTLYVPGEKTKITRSNFLLTDWLKHLPLVPEDDCWLVEIKSPLRLRKQKQYLSVPDWGWSFVSLARKLFLLNNVCGGPKVEKETWLVIKDFLNSPGKSRNEVFWYDWQRYSSRQRKKVPMGGIMGKSYIEPPWQEKEVWWHWWHTAGIFHLGKGTSMGLGKVSLSPYGR